MDTRCEVQSLNRALRSSTCRTLRSSRRGKSLYQLPSTPPTKIHWGRKPPFHGFSDVEVIESRCKLNELNSIVKLEPVSSPEPEENVDRYWLRNGSKNKSYVEMSSSSPEVVVKPTRRRSSRKDKKNDEPSVQFIKVESNDKFEQVRSSSNNNLNGFTNVQDLVRMDRNLVVKKSPELNSFLERKIKKEPEDFFDILSSSPSKNGASQTPVLNSCFEVNSAKKDKLIQIKSSDLNNNDFRNFSKTDSERRAYGKRLKLTEPISVPPIIINSQSVDIFAKDVEIAPKPLINIGEISFSNMKPELICIGKKQNSPELNSPSVDVSDTPLKKAANTVVKCNSDVSGFDDIYFLGSPNIDLDSIVPSIQEHIDSAVLKEITDDLFCDNSYLNSITPARCSNKDSVVPNSDNSACTSPETFFLDKPFNGVVKNDNLVSSTKRIGITSNFLEDTGDCSYFDNDSNCEVNKNYRDVTDQIDRILLEITNEKLVPFATAATSTYSNVDTLGLDDLDLLVEVLKKDLETTGFSFDSNSGSVKFENPKENLEAHQGTVTEKLAVFEPQKEHAKVDLDHAKGKCSQNFPDNVMHCFRQLILSDKSPPSISLKSLTPRLETNLSGASDIPDGLKVLSGAKANDAGNTFSESNTGFDVEETSEPSNEGFAAAFARSLQSLYGFERECVSPLNDEDNSPTQTDNSEECTLTTIGDYVSPIPSHIEKSFYMSPTIRELDMSKFVQYFDMEKIKKSNDPELEFSKQLGKCEAIERALNSDFRRRQKMGLAPPDPSWQVSFVKRLKMEHRNLERQAASRQFKKTNCDSDNDEESPPCLEPKRRGRKRKGESSEVNSVKKKTEKKIKKTEICAESTKNKILKTEVGLSNDKLVADTLEKTRKVEDTKKVYSTTHRASTGESSSKIESKPCDIKQNIVNEKTDTIAPILVPKKKKNVPSFKIPFKTHKVELKQTETESRSKVKFESPSLLRKSLSKGSLNSNENKTVLEPSDQMKAWKNLKLKVSATNPSLNLPAAMSLLGKTGLVDRNVAMKALTRHADQEFADLKSSSLKTKREPTAKLDINSEREDKELPNILNMIYFLNKLRGYMVGHFTSFPSSPEFENFQKMSLPLVKNDTNSKTQSMLSLLSVRKDLLWKNCAILLQHGDWKGKEEVLKTLMEAMATIPVKRDTILSSVATVKTIIKTTSSKNKNIADAANTLLRHLGPVEEILPFLFMNR